jgi:hypothetical protein
MRCAALTIPFVTREYVLALSIMQDRLFESAANRAQSMAAKTSKSHGLGLLFWESHS